MPGKKKSQRGKHLPKLNEDHPKADAKRTRDWCSDDANDSDYNEDGSGSSDRSEDDVVTTAPTDPAEERRRRQLRESQQRSRKRVASAPLPGPSAKAQGIAAFFYHARRYEVAWDLLYLYTIPLPISQHPTLTLPQPRKP